MTDWDESKHPRVPAGKINGGVNLNDVREIILHKGPWQAEEEFEAVTDLINETGIPWYWGEDDEY